MAGVCFSPRKRKNCKVNCCVVNCNSSAQKNPNIRFYRFPKENASPVMVRNSFGVLEQSNKLQCWIQALRIENKVTSNMKVCSLHFKLEDFFETCKYNVSICTQYSLSDCSF